jgi:hypothetical protein
MAIVYSGPGKELEPEKVKYIISNRVISNLNQNEIGEYLRILRGATTVLSQNMSIRTRTNGHFSLSFPFDYNYHALRNTIELDQGQPIILEHTGGDLQTINVCERKDAKLKPYNFKLEHQPEKTLLSFSIANYGYNIWGKELDDKNQYDQGLQDLKTAISLAVEYPEFFENIDSK